MITLGVYIKETIEIIKNHEQEIREKKGLQ